MASNSRVSKTVARFFSNSENLYFALSCVVEEIRSYLVTSIVF